VDETLATGEQWQKLFIGAVKKGTKVMDKNQDLVFDALEEVKAQYLKGNKRFWKLFSFGYPKSKLAKTATKAVKKSTAKVTATAADAKATVEVKAKRVAKKATAKATKTVKTVAKKATTATKKVAAKATPKAAPVKAVVKKAAPKAAVKKTVAKAAPKAAEIKKVIAKPATTKAVKADNLKVIEGIGPKIESLLIAAGMKSFQDLATAPEAKVQAVLDAAGPRFRMHKPATWMEQAALAAAGKMDELKALQAKLDGGRK